MGLHSLVALSFALPAAAQSTLLDLSCGACPPGQLMDARSVGDVDGDGVGDVAVVFRALVLTAPPGRLEVRSGSDGRLIRDWDLDGVVSNACLAGGDVDGDGRAEVVLGLANQTTAAGQTGRVVVLSVQTGAALWSVDGDVASFLGHRVLSGLDVDGDGHDDVVATAEWCSDPLICERGEVRVYSGASGAELHRLTGSVAGGLFGYGLAALGDVDGDGRDDLAVGDWPVLGPGVVRVVRGIDGAPLRTIPATTPGGIFGFAVAGPGDVTGDGVPDVAATTFGAGATPARVEVFSGADGLLVWTYGSPASGVQGFGEYLGVVPDATGDGVDDLLVAEPNASPPHQAGAATLVSGADGALQHVLRGQVELEQFGVAVGGIPDLDGDGLGEVVVGSTRDPAAPADPGHALVIAGGALRAPARSCVGAPNSVGPGARLSWDGTRSIGDDDFTLGVAGAPPGSFALLVHGVVPAFLPFGDGFLCISPFSPGLVPVRPVVALDAAGAATWDLVLGGAGGPAPGESWTFQALYRDRGGAGFNGSDALTATFVP